MLTGLLWLRLLTLSPLHHRFWILQAPAHFETLFPQQLLLGVVPPRPELGVWSLQVKAVTLISEICENFNLSLLSPSSLPLSFSLSLLLSLSLNKVSCSID